MAHHEPDHGEVLRPDDAAAFLGVSKSTFKRLRVEGALPRPIRVSQGVLVWRRAELAAWIASRPRG
jgi:predicted DNA-binding transcriptional regulator AlpA